jgi:hypothetical protein
MDKLPERFNQSKDSRIVDFCYVLSIVILCYLVAMTMLEL